MVDGARGWLQQEPSCSKCWGDAGTAAVGDGQETQQGSAGDLQAPGAAQPMLCDVSLEDRRSAVEKDRVISKSIRRLSSP